MDKVSGGEFQDINGGKNAETNISQSDMQPSFVSLHMRAHAPMFDTVATPPKYAILGDFMGDCIGDLEACAHGMTLSFRVTIPGSLSTKTRLLGARTSGRGYYINYAAPSDIIFGVFTQSEFIKISLTIVKDKQYHIAMVWTKEGTLKVYANGVEFSNMVRSAQVSSGVYSILKIGKTDVQKGSFRLGDVAVWKRELSAEEINQRLACAQVGIGKKTLVLFSISICFWYVKSRGYLPPCWEGLGRSRE